MKYPHCYKCRDEVEWYVLAGNSGLVVFKGFLGVMSGSAALIADTFHSLADVLATIFTLFSLKISARAPDQAHAYGYGKIQHISTGTIGLLLLGGSMFILTGSVMDVVRGTYEAPNGVAVLGAFLSILANEFMFRYESCVAKENNSPAIMANAWDNRSDALSSLGVLIGIFIATFMGFPVADPLTAIIIAMVVIKIAVELMIQAINNLMDATPDFVKSSDLFQIIRKLPAVTGINYLRARSLGEDFYIEADIRVDQRLKVYEGDLIVAALEEQIKQKIEHVGSIQIYLSPEETQRR
ncbi:MAG: magnetosome biogenesis CDF transporter MamB [Pseudomonadota bacterium]